MGRGRKKEFQKLLEADYFRFKDNFHSLGVTGRLLADLTVSRVFGGTAGIPNLGVHHPSYALKLCLQPPKTPPAK